ncbi:MAG: CHAD domain-containing protein [Pseudonocardiaceae bacterium]
MSQFTPLDSPGRRPLGRRRRTRKAAKRLRYATESVGPALGKPATRLKKALKSVQSLLGDHQDAGVLRPVLRELAGQAHLEGGNGFTYGLLHAAEAARAERAEHDLPAAWERMRIRKNTAWLTK